MRYRFIAAAVAATAIAATAALTGAGMASASTTVTGSTSMTNVPDTTNASGPACLATVNGAQWATDQDPDVTLSATELTSPANTWNVTITSNGSFKGFADPLTCAALVSSGSLTGTIQYTVTSPTPPVASGLKSDYTGETEFSTLIDDFFGDSPAIGGGDIYNFSYQNGNYTQVGTEGGGLVITGDVVGSTAVVPDVVGQRVNPAESAIQAAGFKVVTNIARNPLDTYVVTGQSAVGKTALGTTVTLKIALTTKSVTVPKVIGQHANQGLATIRAAGLMAVTNPLRKSTGTYVITSESPAAGTKVTPGAKIVVGVKLVS
jgi:PASTA domain